MMTILLSYGRDTAINDFAEWLALVSNVTKTVKMPSKQIKEICVYMVMLWEILYLFKVF